VAFRKSGQQTQGQKDDVDLSLEKALKALMNLGLTQMDSQVYVYLAKKGPHGEKDLVYALNTTDQQICRSLRNLQEKGFITSKTERQTVFTALPLEKVLENMLKAKTEETRRMEQDKESFLSNTHQ
jgi:sugar-specific transcriptional regulator TrmB